MSIWRLENWNGRGGHRQVFRYSDKYKHRMGHCDWLPQDGDLCIRTEDAGDCFHKYVAMRQNDEGKLVRIGSFGAYIFGEPICTLDERTFYLVCSGEPIEMPNAMHQPTR